MAYSTFMGLETARRALSTARTAMDVTGHNVANASTPGYTRQRALQEADLPYTVPSLNRPEQAGQIGTGVTVEQIQRIRDNFLDSQIRAETNKLGNWQAQNDALSEIETIFMEPSDNGLNTLLADFWSGWQELSKNAESSPIRTTLIQNAFSLANGLNSTQSQLETVRGNLNQLMDIYLDDINAKAGLIAGLNTQIINIQAVGDQPNDLMDRRDLLLDELAQLTNLTVTELGGGSIQVNIGTFTLVDGGTATALNNPPDPPNPPYWADLTGGALDGINKALVKLQSYEDDLNAMAVSLINVINDQHNLGFDLNGDPGIDLFNGTGAGDITVLITDPSKIAASSIGNTDPDWGNGNGGNALEIAGIQNKAIAGAPPAGLNGTTFDNFYKNLVARLGVDTQESSRMVLNQQALVDQLTNRKESISGVSMDEEMSNLIQYQYAYQGAARVITTLDEMLDTLINRMAV